MLSASGSEIQWNKDGSRESCIVIIVLVAISLQFPYLHKKNKDNVFIGEMVKLYKVSIPEQTTKKLIFALLMVTEKSV